MSEYLAVAKSRSLRDFGNAHTASVEMLDMLAAEVQKCEGGLQKIEDYAATIADRKKAMEARISSLRAHYELISNLLLNKPSRILPDDERRWWEEEARGLHDPKFKGEYLP